MHNDLLLIYVFSFHLKYHHFLLEDQYIYFQKFDFHKKHLMILFEYLLVLLFFEPKHYLLDFVML